VESLRTRPRARRRRGRLAGVSLIAAVLFVVQVVWPRGGNTPVIECDSRFAAVAQGLACIVPAVATVVVFSFVHDVWRDLRYGDEGDDVDADFADSAAEGQLPGTNPPID